MRDYRPDDAKTTAVEKTIRLTEERSITNDFKFGEEEKLPFDALQQSLTYEPVLMIYDRDADTELHTDASQDGLAAMLLQKSTRDNQWHPVYSSKKTNDAERRYTSY